MAEEPSSPYRDAPKAELVVEAGSSSSSLVWAALSGVVVFALWWAFGLVDQVGSLPAIVIFLVFVGVGVWTSRRNRWRFTLERSTLRIERLLPAGPRRIGVLDVHEGLRLRVDVPEQVAGEDPRFTFSAKGEELSFFAGGRARELHGELTRFLREHDVELDAPDDLPELTADKLKLPKL